VESHHFDDLVRSLTGSRRSVVVGALASATGWLGVAGSKAKKKKRRRKRRKNKPQFNQFGCVDVGGPCFGNGAHCCSGLCEGTGKTSVCASHNELGCDADDDTCSESVPCGAEGICYRTTGKAGFCADRGFCDCGVCKKDTDCEAQFGPGAACVVCTGDCDGVKGSQGTACAPAGV
jgi:hypothetical protein